MNYNFRGTYNSTLSYTKLDVVMHKNGTNPKRIYLCLTNHTNASPQEPSANDTIYWGILNADSNFPEQIDSFLRNKNMTASDVVNVNRYQELYLKTTRTPSEDIEMNTIADALRDKQISIEDFNQLKSSIENMQYFIKNEVEGYINTRKTEFDNAVSEFKDVGAYSAATNYISKNMVKFNGNVYIAKINSFNKTPVGDEADLYWRLISFKGDTGQAGISVAYKGDYNNSTSYITGDGVSYSGNLFYAKQNSTANLPTNSTYWHLADKIYVGIAPPAAPQTEQVWLDISGTYPVYMYWNGSTWINLNAQLNTHMVDYTSHVAYVAVTGSANTYVATLSPALTSYVAGVALAVKINATNTGASTINVNGLGAKAILDSKGNALIAGKLTLNSVYTIRYNGTSFILQGEGGDYGTAVAADVLAGKTVGTDSGIINGTMVDRGTVSITPSGSVQTIAAGKHSGSGSVAAVVVPVANVLTGTTIAGQAGTMPNRGTQNFTPSASSQSILSGYSSGGTIGAVSVPVANVLSGTVIAGQTGAMVNRSTQNHHQPALEYTMSTAAGDGLGIYLRPPEGYYNGGSWVYQVEPDIVAANIVDGANILGVVGTATKLLYLSAPTARTGFATTGFNILKRITVNQSGNVRVSYHMFGDSNYTKTVIAINGGVVGTERINYNAGSGTTFTQDFYCNSGDQIQFCGNTSNASFGYQISNALVTNAATSPTGGTITQD